MRQKALVSGLLLLLSVAAAAAPASASERGKFHTEAFYAVSERGQALAASASEQENYHAEAFYAVSEPGNAAAAYAADGRDAGAGPASFSFPKISLPHIELPEIDFSKISKETEKERLREALESMDDLGISPKKLVRRVWNVITPKENGEKAGRMIEKARRMIEKAGNAGSAGGEVTA